MKTNEDHLKEIYSHFKTENPDNSMENLIVDAIETGIGYWCSIWPNVEGRSEFYSVNVWEAIKRGETLVFGESEYKGTINLGKIIKAFGILMKEMPRTYADIKEENYDSEIADIFFQTCLFGETIFG